MDNSEDEEENKMEITRNPFDSNLYDKENYPVLDASIFAQTTSPTTPESSEFRWSIGQVALMNPADLDLCPNQEYSILHANEEDELKEQMKVDEFFQNVLLPSPWLEERNESLKRVTFSPHPPSLRYIPAAMENRLNSSDGSIDGHLPKQEMDKECVENAALKNNTKQAALKNNTKQLLPTSTSSKSTTTMSDACCQTKITIPINFDLDALLEKQLSVYLDIPGEGKELMVSTLRRKLFEHDIYPHSPSLSHRSSCVTSSPRRNGVSGDSSLSSLVDDQLISPVQARRQSLLESPSLSPAPPGSCVHSLSLSPGVHRSLLSCPSLSPVEKCVVFGSPWLSPVRAKSVDSDGMPNYSSSSCGCSPKHASNVGMSPSKPEMMLSVGVSPIRGIEKVKCRTRSENCSFMPDVSFDTDESSSDGAVKESSRAIEISSPGVSPIQYLKVMKTGNSTLGFSVAMDSMALETSGRQSVKESTARNIHAFSGIDMSSIGNGSTGKDTDYSKENPPEISKLSRIICEEEEEEGTDAEDGPSVSSAISDESTHKVNVTTTTTAATPADSCSGIPETTSETLEQPTPTISESSPIMTPHDNDYVETPLVFCLKPEAHASPLSLKGILKRSDDLTPTRPMSELSTSYNTICNSGKKRPTPCISSEIDNRLHKHININRSLTNEFDLGCEYDDPNVRTGSENLDESVSVLAAAPSSTHPTMTIPRHHTSSRYSISDDSSEDKENYCSRRSRSRSPMDTSGIPSTRHNVTAPSGGIVSEQITGPGTGCGLGVDSGIGSLEWSSELKEDFEACKSSALSGVSKCGKTRANTLSTCTSVTPLMQLNKLRIHDKTPWSARRTILGSDSSNYSSGKALNRYSSKRSFCVSKSRTGGCPTTTPRSVVSRARPRFRSERISLEGVDKQFDCGKSLLSAYKDLLPSPLK